MLVPRRKKSEEILVGVDLRITLERIAGNRVALSIRALETTQLLRGELHRHDRPFIEEREPELESVGAEWSW